MHSFFPTQCDKVLEDFVERAGCELTAPQLPKDATVYELTSNTVLFLQQLTDLVDTVGPILAPKPSYANHALVHVWPTSRNQVFLGLYISKLFICPFITNDWVLGLG